MGYSLIAGIGGIPGFFAICYGVMHDNFIKSACLKFLSSPIRTDFPGSVAYHLTIIGTGVVLRILMSIARPPGVFFNMQGNVDKGLNHLS